MPETKTPHDMHAAITAGLGAVGYMANRLAQTARDYEFMGGTISAQGKPTIKAAGKRCDKALCETLRQVDCLMQFLGNFLSNGDMVEEMDKQVTTGAFAIVKKALKEPAGGTTTNR